MCGLCGKQSVDGGGGSAVGTVQCMLAPQYVAGARGVDVADSTQLRVARGESVLTLPTAALTVPLYQLALLVTNLQSIANDNHPSATQWQHRSTIRQWQLSAAISQVNPTLAAQRKQWKTNRDSFCRLRPEWSGLFASSGGSQQQKPSLRELRARPAGASPARRFNSTNCIVMSSSLYIVSHEI